MNSLFRAETSWLLAGETQAIEIGDASLSTGRSLLSQHTSHRGGSSVDFRPLKTSMVAGSLTWRSPNYDRSATQRFVDTLRSTGGVQTILFNDPLIKGVTPYRGHDNHLHVKFRQDYP